MFLLLTIGRVISINMARTKQTGRLARMTDLQQVERHQAMAAVVRKRRRHRRTRDIAPPVEVAQVLPPRDVHVVQPEGVPRPEATATDPVADEPWQRVPIDVGAIDVQGTSPLLQRSPRCLHRGTYSRAT